MVNMKHVGITSKGEVTFQDLLNLAKSNPEMTHGGAIATFTGIVKGYTDEGKEVQKLVIEAYEEVAYKALTRISKELCARSGIIDVFIYHFIGEFDVGEDLVYVVVVGKSRKDVFKALEEAVERYKKEAALWKKEYLKDGTSYWISK